MSDSPTITPDTGPTESKYSLWKNQDYEPIESNWFTAKPYGFRFAPRDGEELVMYLPLGPSNLNISTQFATNLIPTISGTIEEHSPVRYYDISIEGTTGMTPKFVEPTTSKTYAPKSGRSSFTVQQSWSSGAGGLFAKTLSAMDKIYNTAVGMAPRTAITGVHLDQTGYMAFHNLYRFFLQYKKDVAGVHAKTPRKKNAKPPLVFFNHKDNNEYSVVIQSFMLRRDKENPMLYSYSISLRGYDLTGIDESRSTGNSEPLLEALGLDGIQNTKALSDLKRLASDARDILGSAANGINQLGR